MKYNKSMIMKRAWEIKKTTEYAFSVCLKTAWAEAKTGEKITQTRKVARIMKEKLYDIIDCDDVKSIVYETKRQKDILDILDEGLEDAKAFGWSYIFRDEAFFIEYTDGNTYEANECGEYGTYKKKGISRIIYENVNETQVYGNYEVNEYGIVS